MTPACLRACIFAVGLSLPGSALAQPAPIWTLITENDSYLPHSDRYYTNGLQLAWTSAARDRAPHSLADVLFPLANAGATSRHGFFLGQAIFTPRDLTRASPDPRDRPYAGWLYAGANLIRQSDKIFDRATITLGLVGPSAGGAFAQNQWHKTFHGIVGGGAAQGWDHQLRNEPGIQAQEQRAWRFVDGDTIEFGFLPEITLAAGNIATYAGAGALFEIGRHIRTDWGPPRIGPGLAGSDSFDADALHGDAFGWYVFAGFEARAVARNIFLDGNSFRAGPHVEKKPIVADLVLGLALTGRWGRIALSATRRSHEFTGQRGNADFLSVALSL